MEYEIKKVSHNHYVKLVDGKIVGPATEDEVAYYTETKNYFKIDFGVIEVALAILGVLVIFILDKNFPFFIRLWAVFLYMCAAFALYFLFVSYIINKVSIIYSIFYRSGLRKFKFISFSRWLVLSAISFHLFFVISLGKKYTTVNTFQETGLLYLYIVFVWLLLGSSFFVAYQLFS